MNDSSGASGADYRTTLRQALIKKRARPWWTSSLNTDERLALLTAADHRLIRYMNWLERCSRRDRPHAAPLVRPSQGAIAQAIGVSREWVNRRIRFLSKIGLIDAAAQTVHPASGQFQTCRYKLPALVLALNLSLAPAPHVSRVQFSARDTIGYSLSSSAIAQSLSNRHPRE
jgi:hypothetical protein